MDAKYGEGDGVVIVIPYGFVVTVDAEASQRGSGVGDEEFG